VPHLTTGTHTITATGASTGSTATSPFVVIGPTVSAISPNNGKLAGGTVVTITGSNFNGTTTVDFGTKAATAVKVVNATTITATSPSGTGAVDVTVSTTQANSATSPADVFNYLGKPTITSVSPASGPQSGGSVVTISGTNFANPLTVYFGPNLAAAATVVNSSTIIATAPPGTATINVKVDTSEGYSPIVTADLFAYELPPTVTYVTPAKGPAGGGTSVTIHGSNFGTSASVSFGGVPATKVVVLATYEITAVAPPHAAGTVDITVTNAYGKSSTSSVDHFTYTATT
jgi:hypothetical protein